MCERCIAYITHSHRSRVLACPDTLQWNSEILEFTLNVIYDIERIGSLPQTVDMNHSTNILDCMYIYATQQSNVLLCQR